MLLIVKFAVLLLTTACDKKQGIDELFAVVLQAVNGVYAMGQGQILYLLSIYAFSALCSF